MRWVSGVGSEGGAEEVVGVAARKARPRLRRRPRVMKTDAAIWRFPA